MSWWQMLLVGGGASGSGGLIWRVFKNRKLREIAADVLDPTPKTGAVEELRFILDEQRKGYEHLAGRVGALELTISTLERRLIEEQSKARSLQKQLREERKLSGIRIADLERELQAAKTRIEHLEQQLAYYNAGADGSTPSLED
jgi:predicted  nucleic acid-binding Zn-ribbon protein